MPPKSISEAGKFSNSENSGENMHKIMGILAMKIIRKKSSRKFNTMAGTALGGKRMSLASPLIRKRLLVSLCCKLGLYSKTTLCHLL